MTSAAAEWSGTARRGAATITVTPGHTISVQGVREKLAVLDALSMQGVLSAAEDTYLTIKKYEDSIGTEYFGGAEAFVRYKMAQAQKDWRESDRLFLSKLTKDGAKYRKILGAEEMAHAFSAWLCGTALISDHAYRWIDPPEFESCMSGTFESRIESDGT